MHYLVEYVDLITLIVVILAVLFKGIVGFTLLILLSAFLNYVWYFRR